MMLWIKAFHIIAVICWFAGIFYLPRLFVNHAMVTAAATRERLVIMARKLFRFVTPFMVLTLGLGAWLVVEGGFWSGFSFHRWLHVKIALVLVLCGYHEAFHACTLIAAGLHFTAVLRVVDRAG